jgi:hypothetical protein
MQRKVVSIHIGVTSALLGGLALLYKHGDLSPDRSLYHTVHVTALSVVAAALYYGLFEALRPLLPPDWGFGRRDRGHVYASVDCERSPLAQDPSDEPQHPPSERPRPAQNPIDEAVRPARGRPRLTMGSVWGLVYGLGCVFFVTLYCASGQQTICSYFFGLGLACMSFDELLRPLRSGAHAWRQRILEALAVGLAVACIALVSIRAALNDNDPLDVDRIDLFSVIAGMALPLLAPLLLGTLKNPMAYSVGNMLELCEFGLPFMFILGCGFVVTADGHYVNLYENTFVPIRHVINMTNTHNSNDSGTTANVSLRWAGWDRLELVAPVVALGPLLGIPALVLITTAVLRDHVSDPLVSVALVIAAKTLLEGGLLALGDPLCVAAIVAAKLGLVARLASTAFEPATAAQETGVV